MPCNLEMALSYDSGPAKVLQVAQAQRVPSHHDSEITPLHKAVRGIAAQDIISPRSISEYDTSAMNG